MPLTFIPSFDEAECLERRDDVRVVKELYLINRRF
jgi:hypothetical protein